jgi:hypothetical protein
MVFRTLAVVFIALSVAGAMAQNTTQPVTTDPAVDEIVKLLRAEDEAWPRQPLPLTIEPGAAGAAVTLPPDNPFQGKFFVILGISTAQNELFERLHEWLKAGKPNNVGKYQELANKFLTDANTEDNLFDPTNWKVVDSDAAKIGAITSATMIAKRRVPRKAVAQWLNEDLGTSYVIIRAAVGVYPEPQWTPHELRDFKEAGLKIVGYHKLTYLPHLAGNEARTTEQALATYNLINNCVGLVDGVVLVPSKDFALNATQSHVTTYLSRLKQHHGITNSQLLNNFAYLREPFRKKDSNGSNFTNLDEHFLGKKNNQTISNIIIPVYYGVGYKFRTIPASTSISDNKAERRLKETKTHWKTLFDRDFPRNIAILAQADDSSIRIRRSPTNREITFVPQILNALKTLLYNNKDFHNFSGLGLYNLDEAGSLDIRSYIEAPTKLADYKTNYPVTASDPVKWDIVGDIDKWKNGDLSGSTVTIPLKVLPADNRNPNWCWVNIAYAAAHHSKVILGYTKTLPLPSKIVKSVSGSDCGDGITSDPNEGPCSTLRTLDEGLTRYYYDAESLPTSTPGAPPIKELYDLVKAAKVLPVLITKPSASDKHFLIVVGVHIPKDPSGKNDETRAELLVYDPAATPEGGVVSIPYQWLKDQTHPDKYSRPAPALFLADSYAYIEINKFKFK